jgi:hypothetical protein
MPHFDTLNNTSVEDAAFNLICLLMFMVKRRIQSSLLCLMLYKLIWMCYTNSYKVRVGLYSAALGDKYTEIGCAVCDVDQIV